MTVLGSSLMGLAEAAELLGLTVDAVQTAARKELLATRKIGQRTYATWPEAVEAYRRDHLGRVGRPRNEKEG